MTQDLNLFTMEYLYQNPPPEIEYLVDGLLTPGLYLLGGSPKVGKSWMALSLCLAVCRGKPFLGRTTQQGEVLYLALEDGPQRLYRRALRLSDSAPTGLYLCGTAQPIGGGLEQQLAATLEEHPAIRLVIIDTLQKVRGGGSGTVSYGNDYQDATALKALADRYRVCLLAIHHLRKMSDSDPMNRLSGTNGLTGAADGTLILLRENRQGSEATLNATGRDIEDVEETLDFAEGQWRTVTPFEKVGFDLMLHPLQELLRAERSFAGTATQLAERLAQAGASFSPAQLSRYIQGKGELLARAGIQIETKRTSSQRTLCLTLDDSNDGNDSDDRENGAATVCKAPSLPSQPSLAS